MEKMVAVAIRLKTGEVCVLPIGKTHEDVMDMIGLSRAVKCERGYLNSEGDFVSMAEIRAKEGASSRIIPTPPIESQRLGDRDITVTMEIPSKVEAKHERRNN